MDNVEQERVASPRPWRLGFTEYRLAIRDADRRLIFAFLSHSPDAEKDEANTANAELIVDAVNAYDRVIAKEKAVADEITHLRQTLKKLADMYMDHTIWRLSRDEQALIDEARAAIGNASCGELAKGK